MPTPLPVIANTFRTSFEWIEGDTGQTAANVMHFRLAGNAGDLIAALIAETESNQWAPCVPGAFVNNLLVTPLDGTSATVDSGVIGAPSTPPWAGGSGGEFVPAASAIVKLSTGVRGRDNRGRVYLPFISEAAMADGQVSAGTLAAMVTAWSDFLIDLAAHTPSVEMVVASYDRAHAGAGAHATAVITAAPERVLGTQRRRQSRLR